MFNYKIKIFVFFALVLFCLPVSSAAQKIKNGKSGWNWQTKPDKDKHQLNFALYLEIKGRKASGTFTFRNIENSEDDTRGDGNVMPFSGRLVGGVIKIEFYADDIRNAEDDDSYTPFKRIKGKSPDRATLIIKKGKLVFVQTKGKFIYELPRKLTMRKLS